MDWNLSSDDQAVARVHRLNGEHPVTVFRLIMPGTADDYILRKQVAKGAVSAGVLQKGGVRQVFGSGIPSQKFSLTTGKAKKLADAGTFLNFLEFDDGRMPHCNLRTARDGSPLCFPKGDHLIGFDPKGELTKLKFPLLDTFPERKLPTLEQLKILNREETEVDEQHERRLARDRTAVEKYEASMARGRNDLEDRLADAIIELEARHDPDDDSGDETSETQDDVLDIAVEPPIVVDLDASDEDYVPSMQALVTDRGTRKKIRLPVPLERGIFGGTLKGLEIMTKILKPGTPIPTSVPVDDSTLSKDSVELTNSGSCGNGQLVFGDDEQERTLDSSTNRMTDDATAEDIQ